MRTTAHWLREHLHLYRDSYTWSEPPCLRLHDHVVKVSGHIGRSAEVVHSFDLGGGISDPDEELEDCFVWMPSEQLLIVGAGMGHASGIAGCYFSAVDVARAAVGYLGGILTGREAPGESLQLAPLEALGAIARAWRAGAALATAGGSSCAAAISRLGDDLLGALHAVDGGRRKNFMYVGRDAEVAALRLQADRLEFAQAGAMGLYRARGGEVDLVAPVGNVRDALRRENRDLSADVPSGAAILDCVTHAVGMRSEGPYASDPLTAELEVREGDRFLLVTRGVHDVVPLGALEEALTGAGSSDTAWIARTAVEASLRAEGRRGQHPTAIAFATS